MDILNERLDGSVNNLTVQYAERAVIRGQCIDAGGSLILLEAAVEESPVSFVN